MNFEQEMNRCGAIVDDHFVYKLGTHGNRYIDKERFPEMGARKLTNLIYSVGATAIAQGLDFCGHKKIGIMGPAYGAIPYSLALANFLEIDFPDIKFFPAHTEVDKDEKGRRFHFIPEKLLPLYQELAFFIFEDIVNNGTSIREVKLLLIENGLEVLGAISFADRGGQTKESLGVKQYYPFLRKEMSQHNAQDCPQCQAGIPINTILGKGKIWVNLFGQPPYPPDMDFSAFWK